MVRFARSDGSKGSNKRKLEEATPWLEMVDGCRASTVTSGRLVLKKKEKTVKENTKLKSKIPANVTPFPENEERITEKKQDILIQQENVDDQKKIKHKKKKGDASVSVKPEKEFSINARGQRVKVFKDGEEKTWFDLPYEEGERMTRYDNMWVKREMCVKLDQLKQSLKEQDLTEKEVMRKMMKAKRKAHRELRIELIYEQKALVEEQQGESKQPWDTSTKETNNKRKKKLKDNNTKKNKKMRYDSTDVTCGEMEGCQGEIEEKIEEEYDHSFKSDRQEYNSKHKHSNFGRENYLAPKSQTSGNFSCNIAFNMNTDRQTIYNTNKCSKKTEPHSLDSYNNSDGNNAEFEENELMTLYDGYWVRRSAVEKLDTAKKVKLQNILAARTDGNTSHELSPAEKISYLRIIKKEKRYEHKLLQRELNKRGRNPRPRKQKPQEQELEKQNEGEVVKFDGFWVKKESAVRLTKLQKRLVAEGLSDEELKKVMQKERRKEERLLKNERQLVCLKCRQPGHMVSGCPEAAEADGTQVAICYTCGSTEHTAKGCTLKRKGSEFSHATCFICKEVGHISRECPDNPRGLYPNGGACRTCGSVEHFVKDCPDLQEEQEKSMLTAQWLDGSKVEALEEEVEMEATAAPPATLSKVKHIFFD